MNKQRLVAIAMQIDEPYPHHHRVLAGIQRYAREQEAWQCLIDEHPAYHSRRRGAHYRRYDGVIARASVEMQRRLKRLGIPLVNTHFQTARPGQAGVYEDPRRVGRRGAEHLMERGFHRLGIQFDREHKHSREICEGFKRRAAEEGVSCSETYFPERPYVDASYWLDLEKFLGQWLETMKPPVGLFIELAATARVVVQLCQTRGYHIPQEMAVLCHHNLKAVVEVPPQISSMDDSYERVGYEAASLLDRLMAGEPIPDKPILMPPYGVIARESTDYFAVEDEVVAQALRYVAKHLREPLGVEQVAYQVEVSPRSLQLRFAAALGRPVSHEIRRLRLEAAKRMLMEPDQQISSIASLTGFGSSDVMNQVFRRELDMSPSAYRKQMLGERTRT